MLKIYQTTDPQVLFERFADDLHATRRGVFDRATVIVPSMTVRDDLDNRLADHHGISALVDAKFFGMFAWALVEQVTGSHAPDSHPPLSRTAMQWRMFAVFAERADMAGENAMDTLIAELTHTLDDPDARLKRLWQLAGQLARLFVRYLHMRADWLTLWGAGQGAQLPELFTPEEWQAVAEQPDWMQAHYRHICAAQQAIWQHCFADAFAARGKRLDDFWQTLADSPVPLPNPLFVYGLENVDADMYAFLERLAAYTDIYVYHQAISTGYFADMVDDRWLRQLRNQGRDEQRDSIHPLLSRFGKQQRDIFRQWIEPEENTARTLIELPACHPEPSTLLAVLQSEIRDLDPNRLQHHTPDPQDDSLRIHACHGLMRQLEVLRGELTRWFREDPTRQPADVLIVLPELDDAQALVRTVFPPSGDYDGHILPARMTGITPPAAQNLWHALEGLYTLPDTRFEAERVLTWLRREEVCAMLDIAPSAMNRLCDALIAAGYRRGLNREQLGNPDDDPRFTFCYALDRLLTGLWMPDIPQYRNTVPQHEDNTEAVAALCRLALHWQHIWRARRDTAPVRHWTSQLHHELMQRFPDATTARRTLELALRDLDGQMTALEAHTPAPAVPLAFVLADIGARLSAELTGSEPSGVMTIGRLGAMRTLSYKLIVFVNANIADFPANPPDDRYDLSRLGHRRLGDLNPEHEDLAAFLDILCHARDALWIFYDQYPAGGREPQLPAQPVQELLSYLNDELGEQNFSAAHLIREHPADPFQSDAPDHPPAPLWQSVREHSRRHDSPRPFLPLSVAAIALDAPLRTPETLDLDELRRPLLRPLAAYLRQHDIAGEHNLRADPVLEPLHLDALERHTLDTRLIDHPDDPRLPYLPLLPAGAAGHILLHGRQEQLRERRARLLTAAGQTDLPPLTAHTLTLDALTLTAPLPPRDSAHLILLPNRKHPKHLLTLWLRHLLWQLHGGRGNTWGAFADDIHIFRPAADPEAQLRAWLNVRQSALQHPWLLPVDIGMAWADNPAAGEKILQKWRNTPYPDEDHAALAFLTRAYDPADIDALILAHAEGYATPLYAPILQHSENFTQTNKK